jgi:hypothetical protein
MRRKTRKLQTRMKWQMMQTRSTAQSLGEAVETACSAADAAARSEPMKESGFQ